MTSEEWRPITAYPGYEVSSAGRVRRYGSLLSPGIDKSTGYVRVALVCDGRWRHVGVHILVAEAFLDRPREPGQTHVNHLDGVKTNNVYTNLEYATPKANAEHARQTGLATHTPSPRFGEEHLRSKLTDSQISEMRRLRCQGLTYKAIGALFGVSGSCASQVCRFVTRPNGESVVPAAKKFKLTPEDVAAIRTEYRPWAPGCSLSALARKYGVGSSAIHKVVTGVRWNEKGRPSLG